MAKIIRYSLASLCFAASVGCLALWGWSSQAMSIGQAVFNGSTDGMILQAGLGYGFASIVRIENTWIPSEFAGTQCLEIDGRVRDLHLGTVARQGQFGDFPRGVYFPLWYPILIFALAGVSILRFRRRFSIRSVLITTTVVAVLIAMAVIL